MTVRIRSLVVSGPLFVPLSGGGTLRLSPGQMTDELPDVEVADNAKVDKLRAQGLIDVEASTPDEDEKTPPKKTTRRTAAGDGDSGGEG
jgi:hypothetical protein